MLEHLTVIDEEILVCAHTHRPLQRQFPTGRVINVGSVGLPFNRDRRAQAKGISMRLIITPVNVEGSAKCALSSDAQRP